MRFFNRAQELEIIRKAVSRASCFVVVTGRRRIGKTRMIREALKGCEHIEIFIPRKRLPLALENLKDSIQEQTGYAPSFDSIKDVVEYLLRTEKKPIFIDEISNLDFVDSGSFSDLQELIDREKENRGIRLVVDGSYVRVMKRVFQDRQEPLFGRATELIDLNPLNIKDSIKMIKAAGFDFKNALEAYALLGGVPRYIELLENHKDIKELMKRIFTPGSIFLNEGENLLIQEFGSTWGTYFSILEVIADGKSGPSAIAARLGMPVQMIPKYLETLEGLKLVKRERPVLGKQRHVRYILRDPFLSLWFSVCYPRIERYRDGSSTVPDKEMSSAVGKGMERVVKESLSIPGVLPFEPDEIGGYFDRKGNEIDVLAFSKKSKSLVAGEVKWTKRPVSAETVIRLLRNTALVDWHNNTRKEYVIVIAKSGFTRAACDLMKENNILGIGYNEIEKMVLQSSQPRWTRRV